MSSVEISTPEILPALGRNELDGEKIYLQTMVDILRKGIVDEATKKECRREEVEITWMICVFEKQVKDYQNQCKRDHVGIASPT